MKNSTGDGREFVGQGFSLAKFIVKGGRWVGVVGNGKEEGATETAGFLLPECYIE